MKVIAMFYLFLCSAIFSSEAHTETVTAPKQVEEFMVNLPKVETKGEWTPYKDSLARVTEKQYALPHGDCRSANLKENSYYNNRPRVESGFFNIGERHYKQMLASTTDFLETHPELDIPFDVERFQQSTSWGPFQIMGFNLRALGCTKKNLADVTLDEHFMYYGIFMSRLIKQYKTYPRALAAYNTGNPAKTYVPYVKDRYRFQQKFSY